MIIEFSARAEAVIEEIAKWWSKHRDVGAASSLRNSKKPRSNCTLTQPEDNQLWVLTVWGTKRLEPEL